MRRGKEIAQGAHAAMEFLIERLRNVDRSGLAAVEIDETVRAWLRHGTPKICLQVSSEEELLSYHRRALDRNLRSHLVQDSGKTEFGGVPTFTACAIGPDPSEEIDAVTGNLPLY